MVHDERNWEGRRVSRRTTVYSGEDMVVLWPATLDHAQPGECILLLEMCNTVERKGTRGGHRLLPIKPTASSRRRLACHIQPARRQGGPQRLRHRLWVVGTTLAWRSWQPHHQLGRLIRCFHNYLWLQCSTTVKSTMSFHNCYVLKPCLEVRSPEHLQKRS
jgi:hypothetical protein